MLYSNVDKLIKKYSKELIEVWYKLDSNENYSHFSDAFTRICNSIIPKWWKKHPSKDFSKVISPSLFTFTFAPTPNLDDILKDWTPSTKLKIKTALWYNENLIQRIKDHFYDPDLFHFRKGLTSISGSKSELRDKITKNKEIKRLYDLWELTEEEEDIYTQIIHNYSTRKHD